MIPIDHVNWDEYACHDGGYSQWLRQVNQLCEDLLTCGLYDLIATGDIDTQEAYFVSKLAPEKFFAEIVVPIVENEYGHECVHEAIAETILRGKPPEEK